MITILNYYLVRYIIKLINKKERLLQPFSTTLVLLYEAELALALLPQKAIPQRLFSQDYIEL